MGDVKMANRIQKKLFQVFIGVKIKNGKRAKSPTPQLLSAIGESLFTIFAH